MAEGLLELAGVGKKFGTTTAVDNVSLTIERGEFFSLLGPSGCGKTTLLRMVAGFEQTTEGRILINGQDIAPLPPYRRPVNTVFQHYSLFPHMNIFQNIAFGLERKGTPKNQIEQTVTEALDLVRLQGFEKRRPSQLSGGQKQRVALARALVCRPEVLLLDEPLAALDMKLRKEMQVELKNLQERLKITFIFVTHDQEEALVMSDRIAVMNQGRIEQLGKCTEIFEHPETEFVANFMGAVNILEAKLSGRTRLHLNGDAVEIPAVDLPDGVVKFTVRPEKMALGTEPSPGRVCLTVTVTDEIYVGTNTNWVVEYNGMPLTVIEQNSRVADDSRFARGQQAVLSWDPRHMIVLRA